MLLGGRSDYFDLLRLILPRPLGSSSDMREVVGQNSRAL